MKNFFSIWNKQQKTQGGKGSAKRLDSKLSFESLERRELLDAAPVLDLSALNFDSDTGEYSVDIASGSPYQIPLIATDADGDSVTFRVTPENANYLSTTISSGKQAGVAAESNPYLQLTVTWTTPQGRRRTGTLVFELFQNEAPDAVARVLEAVNDRFFNQTLIDFINADKTILYGGSFNAQNEYIAEDYPTIDDNFNASLQHTTKGLIGFIPASTTINGNDTVTAQFYITNGALPQLNYDLSIFGKLVSGYEILDMVSSVETGDHIATVDGQQMQYHNWPKNPVTIANAEIIEGNAFATSRDGTTSVGATVTLKSNLKVTTSDAYTTYMTVTAVDSNGNESDSVRVKVNISKSNSTNSKPFITDFNVKEITIPLSQSGNSPAYVNGLLNARDVDSDKIYYWVGMYEQGGTDLLSHCYAFDQSTGYYEIYTQNQATKKYLSPGVYSLYAAVSSSADSWDYADSQMIPIYILPSKPTGLALDSSSYSAGESDNATSKTSGLKFNVTGVTKDLTVELWTSIDGEERCVGSAVCSKNDGTVTITLDSDIALNYGIYEFTVKQYLTTDVSVGNVRISDKRLESALSEPLTVRITDSDNQNAPTILDPLFSTPSWEEGRYCLLTNGVAQAFEKEQINIQLRATDADEGDVVTWSILYAPESIASQLTLTQTDSSGGATLSWTPGEECGGKQYPLILCAADGRGKFSTIEIEIDVNETQDVPVFYPVNAQAGYAGQWIMFSVKAYDPDPTNSQITIYPSSVPAGFDASTLRGRSRLVYNDEGTQYLYTQYEIVMKLPSAGIIGDSASFTFKALKTTGGVTASAEQNVKVYVISENDWAEAASGAPSLEFVAGSGLDVDDVYITNKNNSNTVSTLSFLGQNLTPSKPVCLFSDNNVIGIETDVVVPSRVVTSTYGWNLADGEHLITIAQPQEATVNTEDGATLVDVMGEMSNALTILIETVPPVLAPQMSNNVITEGEQFTATVTATDDLEVRYSLVDAPRGMTINSRTGVINWKADFSAGTPESITVKATDEAGNVATAVYPVTTIGTTDHPPVVSVRASGNINAVTPGMNLTIMFNGSDPDSAHNKVYYTLLDAPKFTTLDAISGMVRWNVGLNTQPGTYSITVRATEYSMQGDMDVPGLYTDYTLRLTVVSNFIPLPPTKPLHYQPMTIAGLDQLAADQVQRRIVNSSSAVLASPKQVDVPAAEQSAPAYALPAPQSILHKTFNVLTNEWEWGE